MERQVVKEYIAKVVRCTGNSKKDGHAYDFLQLAVETENHGTIYLKLDYVSNLVLQIESKGE